MLSKIQNQWLNIFFCCFLAVFSFPPIDPVFAPGLDSSYFWALNELFRHWQYTQTGSLIYPIGPLGFLFSPFPAGHNLLIAFISIFLIRAFFLYSFLTLGFITAAGNSRVFVFLLATFISFFSTLSIACIGIIAVQLLLHRATAKPRNFLIAALFTTFCLYLKSEAGAIGISMLFSYMALDFLKIRNVKTAAFRLLLVLLLTFISGLIFFASAAESINYSINILRIATGYSEALVLPYKNNFWLLAGCFACMLLFLFFGKSRLLAEVFFVFVFALFIAWKHSITRQDASHYKSLLFFLALFFSISLLYIRQNQWRSFVAALLCMTLYFFNGLNLPGMNSFHLNYSGFSEFIKPVLNIKKVTFTARQHTDENLATLLLNDSVKSALAGSQTDVYPWELMYFAANRLPFTPRKTLQSPSYSVWFDSLTAVSFSHKSGPEYLLIHHIPDRWGNFAGSFDNRCLPNDDPLTIQSILKNYSPCFISEKYCILNKNKIPVRFTDSISAPQTFEWGKWISVPPVPDKITRASFGYSQRFSGKLKSFFYKSELFFIEYKSDDHDVYRYRFIPETAQKGLWINPLFYKFPTLLLNKKVTAIRFVCTDPRLFENTIQLRWIHSAAEIPAESIYHKAEYLKMNRIFESLNDYENQYPYWTKPSVVDSSIAISGKYCEKIPAESYSSALKIFSDSIELPAEKKIIAEATAWIYAEPQSNATLAISRNKGGEIIQWSGPAYKDFADGFSGWQFISARMEIQPSELTGSQLAVFVWNSGKNVPAVFADDIQLKIFSAADEFIPLKLNY